ncbi:hypothetical protein CH339_19465, partial [Rhodobium orientis]
MSEDDTGIAGEEGIGRDELTALLEFYAASGVDAVLADDPVDRFAESRQKALPAGVAERPAHPQAAAPQTRPAP